MKSGIDQDAIVQMFSQATAKQGEGLRKAVSEATLKALQGRELTMGNIRKVLDTVTQAASTGAAQNQAGAAEVESFLSKAFSGMDAALLQAVEANRKALQQFVDQGLGLHEKQLKDALANVEKMEDVFFTTVTKAAQAADGQLQAPWAHVLEAMKLQGTETGARANLTAEQVVAQAQKALRDGRASGAHAAQAMLDSYAALVSGVLIGMTEGMGGAGEAKPAASRRSR